MQTAAVYVCLVFDASPSDAQTMFAGLTDIRITENVPGAYIYGWNLSGGSVNASMMCTGCSSVQTGVHTVAVTAGGHETGTGSAIG